MLKKPFISFDVDSVLLNLEKHLFEFIEKEYNVKITSKDVDTWEYYAVNFPKVIDLFKTENLYDKVEAIEEMHEVLNTLINKYGANAIQIITSSHPNVKESKEKALTKFFGNIKGFDRINIIHVGLMGDTESSHHKFEHSKGTILIDDAIHNNEDHIRKNKNEENICFPGKKNKNISLLVDFDYGWNQDETRIKDLIDNGDLLRVKSAKEIINVVVKIIDNKFSYDLKGENLKQENNSNNNKKVSLNK